MGRSVSYPSGASVAFSHYNSVCETCDGTGKVDCDCQDPTSCVTAEDCNDCEDGCGTVECVDCHAGFNEIAWDDEIEYYQERIREMFPSMEPCDQWIGREDHAIAENRFAYFGISEYCGLVSIWLKPKTDDLEGSYYADELSLAPLSVNWCRQVEERFLKAFGELRKLGNMSNGEGVFERIDKAA